MKKNSARLFIAAELPLWIKLEIHRLQQLLEDAHCCIGGFSSLEHMHLTLQFIGSVDRKETPAIINALQEIEGAPCHIALKGIYFFSMQSAHPIIYCRLESKCLGPLVHAVEQKMIPWFEGRMHKKFIPHITLMRVKKILDNARFEELTAISVKKLSFKINSLALFESVYFDGKLVHIKIKEFPFVY